MATTEEQTKSGGGGRSQQLTMIRALLPKIPLILRVVLLHIFWVSESAKYLDVSSTVVVAVLRSFCNPSLPRPIGQTQAYTLRDPGIKGRIWISKVTAQVPPGESVRDALLLAIRGLGDGVIDGDGAASGFKIPGILPVEAEWTGYRAAATEQSQLPDVSEERKYAEMMKECKASPTVLYFHGGGFYLLDPASHRPTTKRLAKETGGRVYSVRYRLVPQHPFPSAVLDCLVSYLTLLCPPPGAIHEAVPANDIVFAGDSAGGNLCLSLLQVLMELRRQNQKIDWFGEEREIPLPAGLGLNSPWVDPLASFPSWTRNENWDYLPPPDKRKSPPDDDIWPAKPPRKNLYAEDAILLHPLVCNHLNKSWKGAPPMYICSGWETLNDEHRYIASRLARDGVPIVYEEYEALPHVFASILPRLPESKRCFEGWSNFVKIATSKGKETEGSAKITSSFTIIKAKTLEEAKLDPTKLTPYSEEEAFERAQAVLSRGIPDREVPTAKL